MECLINDLMANNLFLVVLVLTLFDIFLGTTRAFVNKEVSSSINRVGITNHIVTLVTIIVMCWVFNMLEYREFSTAFILFYIGSYAISVIESLGKMGVRFPKKVEQVFSDLQEEEGQGGKK